MAKSRNFHQYPVSPKTLKFVRGLVKNIPEMQTYIGEYEDLMGKLTAGNVYFKEHPLNRHYRGIEEPRHWMFSVRGHYPSFFAYWKKCKPELEQYGQQVLFH